MKQPPEKNFLTVTEVASELQISPSLVYQLVQRRKLACHRIGKGRGAIRIHTDDLAEFLSGCKRDKREPKVGLTRRKLRHVDL